MRFTRIVLAGLLVLSLLALAPTQTSAQPKGPARPPVISPFVSLGTNQGLNYFNIARPTLEFRALMNRQEAEMGRLEKDIAKKSLPGLPATGEFEFTLHKTGHRSFRNNTSHYYPSLRK